MTFPVHYTLEQRQRAERLKMAKYRATHREYFKQKDKERSAKRQIKLHALTFAGKFCKLCGIPLATPIYGAVSTKVHCVTCAQDKRTQNRERMRLWRKKQNARIFRTSERPVSLVV